jgi:hypothetical protein
MALAIRRRAKASEVPLFEKEGLGEIFCGSDDLTPPDKSPSIPLFQREKFFVGAMYVIALMARERMKIARAHIR